jgi:CheY-like chemotaxis protein
MAARCWSPTTIAANRTLLRTILQAFGASRCPRRATAARRSTLAGRRDFDLILMDLRMPGLDGASAARRIRAAAGGHMTPILAFSADRDPILDPALFKGAVPKPIEPQTLLAAIAQAME